MELYEYKFNDDHLVYMKEQIWEAKDDLSVYNQLSVHEFTQIEKFINQPKTVIEVGCGLGRGSIYLNQLLKDDSVEYFLCDRTGYTENTGAYDPPNDEFYNDLKLTESFCRLNGIKNVTTFDTEQDDWSTLPQADFLFSLCSFGMHVHIERYIERLISVVKPTSTMVFGTREASYGNTSKFKHLFETVEYHKGNHVKGMPEENWLVLKNPIQQDA